LLFIADLLVMLFAFMHLAEIFDQSIFYPHDEIIFHRMMFTAWKVILAASSAG